MSKFLRKLKDNEQFNLVRNIVIMYSTFLRLNLRKWSQGSGSPPERETSYVKFHKQIST